MSKNALRQRCLESSCEIREEFDRDFYKPRLVNKSNCEVDHREVVRNFMDIPEFWRYRPGNNSLWYETPFVNLNPSQFFFYLSPSEGAPKILFRQNLSICKQVI
jgi:hypothetical protein